MKLGIEETHDQRARAGERCLCQRLARLECSPEHATSAGAQPRVEVRGFWVDTFNTTLNNHADVATVVDRAVAANANTILAQVRRRGDSWYLNSLEPLADRTPIQPGFDPLAGSHCRGTRARARGARVCHRQRDLEPGAQPLPARESQPRLQPSRRVRPRDQHDHAGAGQLADADAHSGRHGRHHVPGTSLCR